MVVVIIVSCIPALIRCCTKHFLCITGSENPHNPRGGITITPTLQMRKPGVRESK